MEKKISLLITLCIIFAPFCAGAGEQTTLILYYSRTGKTRIVAEELKTLIPAARLVEIKSDVGIMKAVFWHQLFNRNACNEPIQVDLRKYDRIILCSPIWLQKISSPIRTIINTVLMEEKPVEMYVVCAGHFGEGGQKRLRKQLAAKKINLQNLYVVKSGGKTDEEINKQVQARFGQRADR